jgi:hypothetical protein
VRAALGWRAFSSGTPGCLPIYQFYACHALENAIIVAERFGARLFLLLAFRLYFAIVT